MTLFFRCLALTLPFAVWLSACERIPEGERQGAFRSDTSDTDRLQALKPWSFLCRATDLRDNHHQMPIGGQIDSWISHFQDKGLSSLKDLNVSSVLGFAFWWHESGAAFIAGDINIWGSSFECSNGTKWWPAKRLGYDSGLELTLIQIESPDLRAQWKRSRWVPRSSELGFRETFYWASSVVPSRLELLAVTVNGQKLVLGTGIDEGLLLFQPSPSGSEMGAILIDDKGAVLGFCPHQRTQLTGLCYHQSYLNRRREALQTAGDLRPATLGMRVGFVDGIGFRIQEVEVNGPAYRAGLRVGDHLTRWMDRDLLRVEDWQEPSALHTGRSLALSYERQSKVIETEIVVGRGR